VAPRDNPDDSAKPTSESARRLLALYAPEKRPLAISLAALSVSAGVTMTLPYGMGHIVDLVASANAHETVSQLPMIGGALSAVFIAGFAANVLHDSIQIMIGERIACRLRDATYRSLLKQELGFFDASRTGDFVSRLSADTALVGKTLSDNISNGFHDLALTVGGTAMLFLTSPQLACVMLGIVPPVALGAVYYGNILEKLTEQVQRALSDATVVADEKLTHIRVVKWFATEQRETRLYNAKTNTVVSLARKRSLASATFYGGVDLSVKMSMLAVLGYGGQMVADGVLTSGELTSFLMYTLYVGFSFGSLSAFYSDLMKGIGASSRIFELLAREPKIRALEHWSSLPSPVNGHIQFEDVRFRYPTRPDSEIFRGLNLEVRPNETIALVGPSGCGKSSVIGLLARFYELDGEGCSGRILLDGVDIATLNTTELRGIVGAVRTFYCGLLRCGGS
jgi:ABC-type multidrug transport system fused ATPase/permease subunit